MSESSARTIHRGRVVHLVVEDIVLPNGHAMQIEIVKHPGAAAIVALTEYDEVILIRQYRHAAGGTVVEIPAGKLDGESPLACAARELEEEAGVTAESLQPLGSILTTPGFSDEVIHLFLARGLQNTMQRLEADEVLTVERIPFEAALERCARGEIRDAKSLCALFLADLQRRGIR
jgi:ADP-ribose pyrophosphatase